MRTLRNTKYRNQKSSTVIFILSLFFYCTQILIGHRGNRSLRFNECLYQQLTARFVDFEIIHRYSFDQWLCCVQDILYTEVVKVVDKTTQVVEVEEVQPKTTIEFELVRCESTQISMYSCEKQT